VGSLLIGAGILAGGGALYLAASDGDLSRGNGASSSRTRLTQAQSPHMSYAPLVGAAALLSMFTGVGMVLHAQHEKDKATAQDVQIGVAPSGVVLSGKL
jgi:hypothetical protein